MAQEKQFAEGVYVKEVDAKYGKMTKIGIKKDDFAKFMKQMEKEGKINENGFLNLIIKTSKKGTQYVELDTFEPDSSKGKQGGDDNKQDDNKQEEGGDDLPF